MPSRKSYYDNLNQLAEGHLYELLKAVGEQPLPENYEHFGPGQRLRVAQARLQEEFTWGPHKRSFKPESRLGQVIVAYLQEVEHMCDPQEAQQMAQIVVERLADPVRKVMNQQLLAAPPQPAIELS